MLNGRLRITSCELQTEVDEAVSKTIKLTSPMAAVYAVTAPVEVRGILNIDDKEAEI